MLSIKKMTFFSLSEWKVQDELLWSLYSRRLSSVRPFTLLGGFSSETPGPNFIKLYVEPCIKGGLKIYKNGHGNYNQDGRHADI